MCVCVWVNTKQEILVNQWNNNDNFLRTRICCLLVALLIDKVSAHTKCLHKKQFSPEHFFYIWLEVIYIWSAFHFLCKFINMCSTRCDITSWCVCVYVCVCVCVCVCVLYLHFMHLTRSDEGSWEVPGTSPTQSACSPYNHNLVSFAHWKLSFSTQSQLNVQTTWISFLAQFYAPLWGQKLMLFSSSFSGCICFRGHTARENIVVRYVWGQIGFETSLSGYPRRGKLRWDSLYFYLFYLICYKFDVHFR